MGTGKPVGRLRVEARGIRRLNQGNGSTIERKAQACGALRRQDQLYSNRLGVGNAEKRDS